LERFGTLNGLLDKYWKERAKTDENVMKTFERLRRETLPVIYYEKEIGYQPPPLPRGAFMDLLPLGKDRVLVFLVWDKQIRVWDEDAEGGSETGKMPAYGIAADWAEPFAVYGRPPHFMFVTESGKVYTWRNAGKATQKLERPLQTTRRIHTLIEDADTGNVWAFAAAPPGTLKLEPVYFLLDPEDGIKGDLHEYRLPEVKADQLPAGARELLPYVKVLENDKRIHISKK
jgi:hypothetical protein